MIQDKTSILIQDKLISTIGDPFHSLPSMRTIDLIQHKSRLDTTQACSLDTTQDSNLNTTQGHNIGIPPQ